MKHFQRWLWLLLTAITWTLGANAATVYFDNSKSNWNPVYIYAWKNNQAQIGEWPGTPMTVYKNSIWKYDLPGNDFDGIIFNCGNNSAQTGDLTFIENQVYIFNGHKTVDGCAQGDINTYAPGPASSPLGAVEGYGDENGTVTFSCTKGSLTITPYGPETVKVFTLCNGASVTEERHTISVCAVPDAEYAIDETEESVKIMISDGITIEVEKSSSLVTFIGKDGNILLAEDKGLSNNISGGSTVSFRGMNDGAFYGGGYNGGWTNWDGKTMRMNNTQKWGWDCNDHNPRCINVPFYVSTSGYGVYFDDHYRDASIKPSSNGTTYSSGSQDPIAYYFMGGGSMEKVMENYTGLTGRQPLPPYWALGYITSRYGYHSESEASEVIDKIKNINAPLDGLVFDLYWEGEDESGMGNLAWHTPKFPDGKKMMADFLKRGVHTVVITEPFFTSRCTNYNLLKNKGWLADEDVYDMTWLKSEKVGLIDASNPDAMSWMADFYEDYTRQGMSGWWLDLGEPERHDDDSSHKGGTVSQIHNEFGNLWLDAVYTRLHDKFPDMRQMLMPRSGTSGMQRYATFPWTGDIQRSWEGLQAQIPALVNSSMSGIGYMGSDTGGFAATNGTDADLYLRWVEFAVFSPSMRTHSSVLPEPYNECYNSIREDVVKYINMRYSYLPYTYTLAYDNATYGIPLARPVNFYDQEPSTLGAVDNEYLWGADILVAPVVENATARDIRFPDGRWMDLNKPANIYQGGTTVNYAAPLGTLPHFGRVGSIIPRFTQATFTNTAKIDRSAISLDVILNPDGESHGRMYDDNRTSFDPVSTGDYLLTDITARHRDTDIDIFLTNEGNGYEGIPDTRTFLLTVHNFILPDDAKVFWGYNHPERTQAMESVIRGSASGDDNGEIAGSNEYATLEALKNAEGEGFVRDRDNNRTHLKVKVPSLSNYVLTLGYSNVATGVETLLTTAPLTLSCHDGIFTYSAPEGLRDLRLEVYTPTGMTVEIHGGLSADGLTHQISTGCTEGLYIGRLSGRDASGAIKTATAKVLMK